MWLIQFILKELLKRGFTQDDKFELKLSYLLLLLTINNPQLFIDKLHLEFWFNQTHWPFSLDVILNTNDNKYKSYFLASNAEEIIVAIDGLDNQLISSSILELRKKLENTALWRKYSDLLNIEERKNILIDTNIFLQQKKN